MNKILLYHLGQKLKIMISHNKDEISDFKEIVTSIRTIRSELNIPPSKKLML